MRFRALLTQVVSRSSKYSPLGFERLANTSACYKKTSRER